MLSAEEEQAVAEQFGVARAQVRRDHLISHLLATLSMHLADRVVFFGGTALSRSLIPNGRLSEDLGLIAIGRRREVAELIERHLVRGESSRVSEDELATGTQFGA
jgi:predicted nucleotidyltransferase component of viral defense system